MLDLRRGETRCRIDPDLAGAILSLSVDGRAILRPAPSGCSDVLETACFPLVPFANRIAFGRMRLPGRDVTISADPLTIPHAHHGHGWRRRWSVERTEADAAVLVLDHPAGDWPWPYRATQSFGLMDDGLRVRIAVTNGGDTPMPAGLGLHPYFIRDADAAIVTGAAAALVNDAEGIPTGERAFAPGRHAVEALEGTDTLLLDTSGAIGVVAAGSTIRLDAPGTAGFHLYVPAGERYFCVEPVDHRPNSMARPDALDLLAPGATRSLTATMTLAAR